MNNDRVCTRCIMDTSDSEIEFDDNGVCNHCRHYEHVRQNTPSTAERQFALERLITEIKAKGRGKEYDCILGVSGGVDSSYTAFLVKKWGLRPLAVHLDNGWNSELAVSNIEMCLKKLGIDLYTHVLDWEEFRDLQIAFLKASVSDAEIPTDHAIVAILYQVAAERGVSYVLHGGNFVTESILPGTWTYGVSDWRYIRSIHRMFGRTRLKRYPHFSLFDVFYFGMVRRIHHIGILNYIDYNKQAAIRTLEEQLEWRPYGGKHYESIYTRFFQGYILPRKFNIDKRKAHLSTLICSGQITRAQAAEEMSLPTYAETLQEEDRTYVLKKFELTENEFEQIMAQPVRTYKEYPTYVVHRKVLRALRAGEVAKRLGLRTARWTLS